MMTVPRGGWWIWCLVGLCFLPVFVAPALPFVDFYAHALRYAILADAGRDPWLAENYRSAWALLPNLGLDILGAALFRVLPALEAARIVVLVAVAAPLAGVLVLARSLHGRITPLSVVLGVMLAHSFILGWGFANFLLGLGIALAALGLWIAGRDRPRRQLAVAVAAGVVIFLTHGFVFALWGAMLATVELTASVDDGPGWPGRAARRLLRLVAVAVLPVLMFAASATAGGGAGVVGAFADHVGDGTLAARLLDMLWLRLDAALRVVETGWPMADRLFGLALWALIGVGLATGRLRLDRRLRLVTALCLVLSVAVPPGLFGVGHLPERLPLLLLAVLAGALVPVGGGAGSLLPRFALLVPLHLGMISVAWAGAGQVYRGFLAATEHLPAGLLAAPAFEAGRLDRDANRRCKPLTFLLGLERGAAVPTFANPTQQPLEITGPLAAAMAAYDARETAAPDVAGVAQVEAVLASGFDLALLCHATATPPPVGGARIVATGRGWTLYRAE